MQTQSSNVRSAPARALRRTALTLAFAATLAATAGIALADELHVPRDYIHLEAAAAAAQRGDTIVLKGEARLREVRASREPIVVPDGVAIVGGRLPKYFTVVGDDLTLRDLLITQPIEVHGDGTVVDGCLMRSATLRLIGDDVVVRRIKTTRARRPNSTIVITGDSATVDGTRGIVRTEVNGSDALVIGARLRSGGIDVNGDRARVEDCRRLGESVSIFIRGDLAVVRRNRVGSIGRSERGITVRGAGAVVEDNDVRGSRDGIRIEEGDSAAGTPHVVRRNRVRANRIRRPGFGIAVTSTVSPSTIADNVVTSVARVGIQVAAPAAVVTGNTVTCRSGGAETQTGIRVVGNDAVVADNTTHHPSPRGNRLGGHGVHVVGSDFTVERNTVKGARGHGLVADGSGSVTDNSVKNPRGHGFALVGDDIVVTGAEVLGCGQEGAYVRATTVRITGIEIRDARGAGMFVHGEVVNADLTGVSIFRSRHGGLVNDSPAAQITESLLTKNKGADLVELTPLALSIETEIGRVSDDPSFLPLGRDEWFLTR